MDWNSERYIHAAHVNWKIVMVSTWTGKYIHLACVDWQIQSRCMHGLTDTFMLDMWTERYLYTACVDWKMYSCCKCTGRYMHGLTYINAGHSNWNIHIHIAHMYWKIYSCYIYVDHKIHPCRILHRLKDTRVACIELKRHSVCMSGLKD